MKVHMKMKPRTYWGGAAFLAVLAVALPAVAEEVSVGENGCSINFIRKKHYKRHSYNHKVEFNCIKTLNCFVKYYYKGL